MPSLYVFYFYTINWFALQGKADDSSFLGGTETVIGKISISSLNDIRSVENLPIDLGSKLLFCFVLRPDSWGKGEGTETEEENIDIPDNGRKKRRNQGHFATTVNMASSIIWLQFSAFFFPIPSSQMRKLRLREA